METVLKPFVNRFAQPIIMSFLIAWLLTNWEIVVGFLWYDNKTLKMYGYDNYRDLVLQNLNLGNNLIRPAAFALIYPAIRFALNYINTFFRTIERKKLLNVSGTGNVSTLKYIQLKNSYDDKIAELSKYLNEQADLQRLANERDTELLKTKSELSQTKESLEDYKQKELVRTDNAHALMMERQTYVDTIAHAESELKYCQDSNKEFMEAMGQYSETLEKYKDKSSPEFLKGITNVKLFRLDKRNFKNVADAPAEIRQGAINYELVINDTLVLEITGYYYNIITDRVLIFFSLNPQDFDQLWSPITNFYHEFTPENEGNVMRSIFKINNQDHTFELIKE